MSPFIYLDNAATTAVRPEVLSKMLPFFTEKAGNPSSIHSAGRETRKAVENARRQVATALHAEAREIYFTAGGSESDNWAIRCAAAETGKKHVITSAVEHHAVLHSCRALERDGFRVTYLPVDENGLVSSADVRRALTDDTALISIMAANNEVGTLEPVREIGQIAREAGVLFHTDAVQAAGAVPIDVNDWNADLLSLSGHKFHGPKGVGALYIRKGTRIHNLIEGGAQERGLRAGTENVPGIVGMGEALSLAAAELSEYTAHVTALRDRLIHGVGGESLLMRLDLAGIACSSGSACTSGSLEPSHVLSAMGLSPDTARSSVRFSLGRDNTAEEIDRVLAVLPPIVEDLRAHLRS